MIFPLFLYGGLFILFILFILFVVGIRYYSKRHKVVATALLGSATQTPTFEVAGIPPQPLLDPPVGILYSLSDVIWSVRVDLDRHFCYEYLNPAVESVFGYPPQDFYARSDRWFEQIDPRDRPRVARAYQATMIDHHPQELEYRIWHRNGELRWLRDRFRPILSEAGIPIRIDGIASDITHQKSIELDLRQEEERLNRIIATISDGLLVVDSLGVVLFVNPMAEIYFGRSRQALFQYEFGLPIVCDRATEITICQPQGSLLIAEMRVSEIIWAKKPAYLITLHSVTERYQAERALARSEEQYRQIVETAAEGIWILNFEGKLDFVNHQLAEMLGYSLLEMMGRDLADFLTIDDAEWGKLIAKNPQRDCLATYDLQFRRRDGSILWGIVSTNSIFDGDGNCLGSLGMVTDITDRKAIEQALVHSEQRLESILNSIQDAVWSTSADSREVLYLNPATAQIYGRPLSDFFDNPQLWAEVIHPSDRERVMHLAVEILETGQAECKYRIIRPGGEIRWLHSRIQVVYDGSGNVLSIDGINSDITEQHRAEAQLQHNATHDSLTQLPNRALFIERLEHCLSQCQRDASLLFAVLFLDLDEFKVVNDSLGHAWGDELLQAIAIRLKVCLRPQDILARLGGDEFTILLEELADRSGAIAVAERIHQSLLQPFTLNGQDVFTNVSIGIAFSATHYQHPQEILRDADTAMYRAKARGKTCYAIFDQQMHQRAVARLRVETDLRRAIERQEFEVYYQPIMNLQERKLVGFEALIRWRHPELGLVSPAQFVPIAEETGLIVPIGEWILQQSCEQLHAWHNDFGKAIHPLQISVNLSSQQLRDRQLPQTVERILSAAHLDNHYLKLEITESMLMENVEVATRSLLSLRDRDIQICLDDFGTGYSSLSYLHRFPVHTLKIDRSFINQMGNNKENSEIVRVIVSLGKILSMDIIAEGIETQAQLQQLCWLGCQKGQGYYFAKPLPLSEAETFIEHYFPKPKAL